MTDVVSALTDACGLDLAEAEVLTREPNLILRAGDNIVRVYRPGVSTERLADIQRVRIDLRRQGVPIPALRSTRGLTVEGRVVEVEEYVEHDGQMNTLPRFLVGMTMMSRVHSLMRDLEVSPAGRTCDFANHIEASDALEATRRGARRMREWGPEWNDHADRAVALAEFVAPREIDASPRQLVHGDFWDDNVYFTGERLVAVADFDFMAERPRLDDLALTLYFTDSDLDIDSWYERVVPLRKMVEEYDRAQDHRLSDAELLGLPWAIARQPLWGYGGWVVNHHEEGARNHAAATERDLDRVLSLARDPRWAEAFVSR